MRAFLGLEVPQSCRRELSDVRSRLDADRRGFPDLRWTPEENLHLTVRFLGSIDRSAGDALLSRLERSLDSFGPLTVRIIGVSWFPSRRPTVLAADVERSDSLLELFGLVEADVVSIGLDPESREPNPHITVARIKGRRRKRVPPVDERVQVEFVCHELVLFESRLRSAGALHLHYGEIPFGRVEDAERS